jgi:hypothetical protein
MSNADSLRQRVNALEDKFFADLDAQLLEELKAKQSAEGMAAEMARVTGIKDAAVLQSLSKLGVSPQSLAALRVFPLVALAWADGLVEENERTTIMDLASSHLGNTDTPSFELLRTWLTTKPSHEQTDTWASYAKALVGAMSDADAETLKRSLLDEVKTVAQASGGLMGWASISKGEHTVLNEITQALTKG